MQAKAAALSSNDAQRRQPDGSDANDDDDDDDEELDGADADASIRPLTPSSLVASSSFTGSTSLDSRAPTSRTFKSFVTGHSKTSGSTKPKTLASASGGAGVSTHARNTPNSPPRPARLLANSTEQPEPHTRNGAAIPLSSNSIPSVEMHNSSSNRIATSIHESRDNETATGLQTTALQSDPTSQLPTSTSALNESPALPKLVKTSSPLRNSFTGDQAPSLSEVVIAAEDVTPPHFRPKRSMSVEERWDEEGEGERRDSDSVVLPSSRSITFSHLPPLTNRPASANGTVNTATSADMVAGDTEVPSHYPRHFHPDPRNNPRASSPPPDNASTLTLASSTGGHAQSIYRDAMHGDEGTSTPVVGTPGIYQHSTSSPAPLSAARYPSYMDGLKYAHSFRTDRTGAAEDASIRALAPSRRESMDSLGSKWSAAVLSAKPPSASVGGGAASTSAGEYAGTWASTSGDASGAGVPEHHSYSSSERGKRRTPSTKTNATASSSYYASASVQPTAVVV